MFGLDQAIANLSDGTKLLVILGIAVLLGLRHATDPDHLTAVTTLLASEKERTKRAAASLGACWGLGHGTTLFLCGVPIVLFKAYLPGSVQQGAETAVGFLIVALAVALLARWRRGLVHVHVHKHDGHTHLHVDTHLSESRHAHGMVLSVRTPVQAYGIGIVHGIGGSAGVGLLLLGSIHSHWYAVAGLVLFALFAAVSMALLSGLVGITLSSVRGDRGFGGLTPLLGVASLLFGVWYALSALQLVA